MKRIFNSALSTSFSKRNLHTLNSCGMIFRQLIDYETKTFTYILSDAKSKEAVIIDPVIEKVERDLQIIKQLDLKLKYALNTHVHADHITGSGKLKENLKGIKSMISKSSGAKADVHLSEGDEIKFGDIKIECISTPGHTAGCMTFLIKDSKILFTGDTLLIRGCGRTDFQDGSSDDLYNSVHEKIFKLPDDFLIYPGHDYNGFTSSSVGEEKKFNQRLNHNKEKFINIMSELNLPYPNKIDSSLPANMVCGIVDNK